MFRAEAALRVLSRTNLAYPSIQPLCNQLLPHSFSQRRLPNPSTFSALRTLLSLTANSFFQSSSICLMIPDTAYFSARINTCKSVSKQTALTPFRINTCEKIGRGGPPPTRPDPAQPFPNKPGATLAHP